MGSPRCVFFRDSTGRASNRLDGKYTPTHLLSEMGKSSTLQEGGQIGWRGLWPSERDALFSSFVVLDRDGVELNDRDAKQIVWKALGDVAKKAPGTPLNAADVLKAGDNHAAAFFRMPFNKYILVTSLSVKTFPAKKVTIRGSTITPIKERKRYPLPKVLQSAGHRNHFADHLTSSQYQLIRISAQGRSVFEGVSKALSDLNLLRALWSFGATLGRRTMRLGSGPRKPIGVIHTGPVYTLHNADGSAANEEYYWFDPDYSGDLELFKHDDRWKQLETQRRWAMNRLARLPYGKDLEELFTRYIAALDQSNPNVAFLQLWGILEKLTDTVGAAYDETIKHTCWVFTKEDRPAMKETLEALRHYRNRYVHSGNAGQESDQITYQIKSFVDPHLVRLLNNTFKVQSIRDYGEFLSYPTDIKRLEQIKAWSSQALRAAKEDEKPAPDQPAAAS